MSDSPSKAINVKYKARVTDEPLLSAQELKRAKNEEDEKKHANFNHMLEIIQHDPQIFQREEMKYLREFVNHIESWRDVYPCYPDDVTPSPVLFSNISHPLNKNFISQLIVNTVHSEIVFNPMLQILETEKEFVFGKYQDSQKYKFCKLTLCDGDNHIIHCSLSINLFKKYNHLKKGIIMRLNRYTPLR